MKIVLGAEKIDYLSGRRYRPSVGGRFTHEKYLWEEKLIKNRHFKSPTCRWEISY